MDKQSSFDILNSIDCSKYVEKKGKFNYLSWTWAVQTLKQNFPDAYWSFSKFVVKGEKEYTLPYMIDPLTLEAWVECSVTVEDITLEHTHPVLDHRNQPVSKPNSFQVNTAQMRCLVKCIGMHGLGLYIYAGEDLPQETLITGHVPDSHGMTVDQNIKLDRLLRDNNGLSEKDKADIKSRWDTLSELEASAIITDLKEGVRLNKKASAKFIKQIESMRNQEQTKKLKHFNLK